MQNHSSQRRELPTAIVLLVSAFALFAFSLGISADAGPAASSCPSCGLTAGDLSGHKCSPTPLTPKQLAIRKHEAHALSSKSQSDWSLGSSDGVPASDLSAYIKSKEHLIALGKVLFWDQRVGSDDRTACATCHYHAGVDTRTRHTDTATNPDQMRFNYQWRRKDYQPASSDEKENDDPHSFGLIKPKNEKLEHQTLIIGSQGIRPRVFDGLKWVNGIPVEQSHKVTIQEAIHYKIPRDRGIKGIPTENEYDFRRVTRRNASTIINSTLLSRLFSDGRAQPTFNGHDAFGDLDASSPPVATYQNVNGKVDAVSIHVPMSAAASQALAPLRSVEEMSYVGRETWHVGVKLLQTRPLLLQNVAPDDSVLGELADPSGKGLKITYQELIQQAFHESWWDAPDDFVADSSKIPDTSIPLRDVNGQPLKGRMALQAINFPLYFGLAIMAYEQTLISDQAPFDRFARGDTTAMSRRAIRGLEKFHSYGCADCHLQPEFAGATVSAVFGDADPPDGEYEELSQKPRQLTRPLNPSKGGKFVEEMKPPELRRGLLQDTDRFFAYDGGFYNIGVTAIQWKDGNGKWWPEDWGIGTSIRAVTPESSGQHFGLDYSRAWQVFPGEDLRQDDQSRVRGAFKTPSLRNIELTKPYMHNGAFLTLEDVLAFYERGPREFEDDHPDAKHWHHPTLPQLREHLSRDDNASADIVAFMKALTDERVRRHAAPFDHPSLQLPMGVSGGERIPVPEKALTPPQDGIAASSIDQFMIRPATSLSEQYRSIRMIKELRSKQLDEAERVIEAIKSQSPQLQNIKNVDVIEKIKSNPNLIKSPKDAAIIERLRINRDTLDLLFPPPEEKQTPAEEAILPDEKPEKLQATGRNGSDDPLAGVSNWDALPE